ncbi:hypothetical protein ES703_97418 [subsurface metagenome]
MLDKYLRGQEDSTQNPGPWAISRDSNLLLEPLEICAVKRIGEYQRPDQDIY